MRFAELADRVRAAPPLLGGSTRLVCVDGPAGSGKTTFADRLAAELTAPVVHLDDLYAGWTLDGVTERLTEQVLTPVAAGRDAVFAAYDWHAGAFLVPRTVPAGTCLVVEGCGAAARSIDHLVTLRVWVQAPPEVCARRWAERGGAAMTAFQPAWATAESLVFAREGTRARADLLVDGDPAEDPGPTAFTLL
ncbi:MAG: Uridine kinase [Klenkia sp.]|nr:Uridine kinase [Klenkia sp.]